jgi:uncharacterized protein YecE (DUF72 family)
VSVLIGTSGSVTGTEYTTGELEEWVPKIEGLEDQTEKTYVFFNKHHEAKSILNARELAERMQQPLPLLQAA